MGEAAEKVPNLRGEGANFAEHGANPLPGRFIEDRGNVLKVD